MSKQDGLAFPKAVVSTHLCRPELRTCSWISGKNPCGSKYRRGEGAGGEGGGGGPKEIMVMKKNEKKKKDEKEG